MSLTNIQYDMIMREYDRRQYRAYREQCARRDEVFRRIPRIREIEESISSFSLAQAEKLYASDGESGGVHALDELRDGLAALRGEKEQLLAQHGYPADYLEMHYTCPACRDTGYVGQRKCECFRREEIRLLYSSSRLEEILSRENFDALSFDVYDAEQQAAMPSIIRTCRRFAEDFDGGFQNLMLYGPVGTGKTFLTNCIAKELLDSRHSVIYFTAFQLFDQFSPRGEEDGFRRNHEAILDSDLLILDDLGTELANAFTVSRLFQVLNERALRRRSTIISTNLSLKDFRDLYSERIFSRITSSYTLLKFTGSDIRIRRKISSSS